MCPDPLGATLSGMPTFILAHRHAPSECSTAFAAWRGTDSPLRRRSTLCTCPRGGHGLWWTLEAPDASAALGQLPEWIGERTSVTEVVEVRIP